MSGNERDSDVLSVDLIDGDDHTFFAGINLQMLSPLLIGLLLPVIAFAYFEPGATRAMKVPILLFFGILFAISAGIFIYTVHVPGEIHTLVVHRGDRALEVVWRSALATRSESFQFDEITALRSRKAYDQDGYATEMAELVLSGGEVLPLPSGTTDRQLQPIRKAIGLV